MDQGAPARSAGPWTNANMAQHPVERQAARTMTQEQGTYETLTRRIEF